MRRISGAVSRKLLKALPAKNKRISALISGVTIQAKKVLLITDNFVLQSLSIVSSNCTKSAIYGNITAYNELKGEREVNSLEFCDFPIRKS
jgi:hypothetical protein